MRKVRLGKSEIVISQTGFGCLPLQRISMEEAIKILRRALDAGITFYDTGRAYADSENKIGVAFANVRHRVVLATKTQAKEPKKFWDDLHASLRALNTEYIDIYQFHDAKRCYLPGDGTGMYECMEEAKMKGLIKHIGVSCHRQDIALQCIHSGFYETIQYPFSYLYTQEDKDIYELAQKKDVGFIAMKMLAGGLLDNSEAVSAFLFAHQNAVGIFGIQSMDELEEWIYYKEKNLAMTESIRKRIEVDRVLYQGDFCRGCGYCMPCVVGIEINKCARMKYILRRSQLERFSSRKHKEMMEQTKNCIGCGVCMKKCPYQLNIPRLLKENYEDYIYMIEKMENR